MNENISTITGVVIWDIKGLTWDDEPNASSKFEKK